MRNGIKIIALVGLCSNLTYAQDYSKSHDSSIIVEAPLTNAINEAYNKGKQLGQKSGKKTKNFFCDELHIQFFCKED